MHAGLKQRVTLLDIAADAGVSRATVSFVIRSVPSVADSTRKRVQRSIKRMGYVYHRGAASLRMRQSHAIGLIVSDITNPFFAEVIVAIEERLATAHLVSLLGNTSEDRAKEERLLQTMREFPADGILICPAIGRKTTAGPLNLQGHLPAVAFARRAAGLDYAGVDKAHGSDLAIEHLCTLGNRRIAFVGGDPDVSTGRERMEGYQRALVRCGLAFDAGLVIPALPTRRGGYESVQRLMQIENRPTAVLCFK
jgi:LacI family transcriptional regulator